MTKAEIKNRVERQWEGNMNIFEIYDELRDNHTAEEQEQLLTHAYNFFSIQDAKNFIKELAYHFNIHIV
ncbi:MAG: hypothetical protein EBY39_05995 [Flavobacteriia bacterium]|nr:hypothetical protein [Flavobacteriia bacterium]